MVAPSNDTWGAPKAQRGAPAANSIDANTKLFQKYLDDAAPRPQKVNKKSSFARVQGGLPPHLLKMREDAPEHTPPITPTATVCALILILLAFSQLTRRCYFGAGAWQYFHCACL